MKSRLTMHILSALFFSLFIYSQAQDMLAKQSQPPINETTPEAPATQETQPQAEASANNLIAQEHEGLSDEQPLGITEAAHEKIAEQASKKVAVQSVQAIPEIKKTLKKERSNKAVKKIKVTRKQIEALLESWEQAPQDAAQKLIKKYGLPDEFSQSDLIWYNNGPWKYTVVSNELIPHNYPHPHNDTVLQVIDYPVSEKVFNILKNPETPVKLLEFNGSITFDRTRGELGAHCDSEATNFLLINLAHDIINNKKSVAEAREIFANRVIQNLKGVPSKLTSGFTFLVQHNNQGDPDRIAPLYKQMMSAGQTPKTKVVKKGTKKKTAVVTERKNVETKPHAVAPELTDGDNSKSISESTRSTITRKAPKKRVHVEPELEMTETVSE